MSSPNFSFEKKLWKKGFKYIAGADEVGRGCFAGPVVASAVVFLPHKLNSLRARGSSEPEAKFQIPRLRRGFDGQAIFNEKGEEIKIDDSKKLTSGQREISAKWIKKNALTYGTGIVSAKVINRVGMAKATQMAFRRAVASANEKLEMGNGMLDNEMRSGKEKSHFQHRNPASHFTHRTSIEYLLIDAFFIPYVGGLPRGTKKVKAGKSRFSIGTKSKQLPIINGDEKSVSIAAASIIAKVYRDSLMKKIGERPRYKRYKWFKNKGYATKEHREAILKYGITGYHRKQFVETYISNFFSSQSP